MGINGHMFQQISNFLTKRTFQVKVGTDRSKAMEMDNGTFQGFVISPLLFLIMINDIQDCVKNSELSLFVDESVVYKSGSSITHLSKQIQQVLDSI